MSRVGGLSAHIAVSPLTRGALLVGFVVGWVAYALLHRAPAGGRALEGDGDRSRSGSPGEDEPADR